MFSFPHVDPDLNILFEKLTAQIGGWIWKTPPAHYTSEVGDFVQSLSCFLIKALKYMSCKDMYFNALIIGLFEICLIMGQTYGEGENIM